MKKFLLSAAAVAALTITGCAVNSASPAPRLTFANFETQRLNVASATVEEAYMQPNDPQDVSGQFVVAPSEAIKRYADKRFQAGGMGNGYFTIAIEDSRVHMRQIAQKNKALEWSGIGQEDEYKVMLQVRVTPQPDGFSGRIGATTIKMERTLVMPSSVTLAEREDRQIKFLEKLIADLDAKIQTALDSAPAIRQ